MDESSPGPALRRALLPLLTRRLFYGAAIACAAGLGLGAWLKPPPAKIFSSDTVSPVFVQTAAAETTDGADAQTPAVPESPPPAEAASAPTPTAVAALSPPAGDDEQPAISPVDNAPDAASPPPEAPRRPERADAQDRSVDRLADGRDGDQQADDGGDGWDDQPPPEPRWDWRRPPQDPRDGWYGPPREPPPDWDGPPPPDDQG